MSFVPECVLGRLHVWLSPAGRSTFNVRHAAAAAIRSPNRSSLYLVTAALIGIAQMYLVTSLWAYIFLQPVPGRRGTDLARPGAAAARASLATVAGTVTRGLTNAPGTSQVCGPLELRAEAFS